MNVKEIATIWEGGIANRFLKSPEPNSWTVFSTIPKGDVVAIQVLNIITGKNSMMHQVGQASGELIERKSRGHSQGGERRREKSCPKEPRGLGIYDFSNEAAKYSGFRDGMMGILRGTLANYSSLLGGGILVLIWLLLGLS